MHMRHPVFDIELGPQVKSMNRLSHMMFALSLFLGLYSLIFGYSVWASSLGQLRELLMYYFVGGAALTIISVPLLYWKAPHKEEDRTTSNRGAVSAIAFITFCVGSLGGSAIYLWTLGIPIIGNLSITMGALITITGALVPDWDIILLGISKHRNVIFHSALLPILITLVTLVNVALTIVTNYSFKVGAGLEYYIVALFLLGYASHLYLDIFPSHASPLEILWRAHDPHSKAPTGLKPLGPIKISKRAARGWLVTNASILVVVALALMSLYFYNLLSVTPSP